MQYHKRLWKCFLMLSFISLAFWNSGYAQFNYQKSPTLQIINDIENRTPYRFLYRDALLTDIRLSFDSDSARVIRHFKQALEGRGLRLRVDSSRYQVIIYQPTISAASQKIRLSGQVVDAKTGERLPFATISWHSKGSVSGTSSNDSGSFSLERSFSRDSLVIKCSYVGYASKTITLDLSSHQNISDLTFRLVPDRIDGNELVVTGTSYYSNIDQKLSGLVDVGSFSLMGESNTIRALQTLPSVSLSPAMSDGLHVRNSPSDGFQVLVDGITIYNQSHLFGLVDSFNADVLKRSNFFYDIAPAQYQAPPGGTLSLQTKTGSLNNFSGSAGISNSSARLSLEGPLKKGSSSWLLAGRLSYMDYLNWFNNSDLIKWGLNVDRPHELLQDNLVDFESLIVQSEKSDATFFDLHGKVYVEGRKGNRLVLSGYFGGDRTLQKASRLYRQLSFTDGTQFEERPVSTSNDWQNGAFSIQYQQWLNPSWYSSTTAGFTVYETSFSKDDFSYLLADPQNQSLQLFTFPFENRSILNEIKAEQELEFSNSPWMWTFGASYHYYLGEYYEDSFDRPGFFISRSSHQMDAYGQVDYSGFSFLDAFAGIRGHYYSNGDFLRLSPRIKLTLFPKAPVSVGGGYSRNHQFLNQISLSNTITSDVWILAAKNQPPTSVDYFSGGIYIDPLDFLYLQAEAYYKDFSNIRLHEINALSLSNTFRDTPWYLNNRGEAKGLEFLARLTFPGVTLIQTLAKSRMQMSNPAINNGNPFYADWDRRYRYAVNAEIQPWNGLTLYLSWMYATGTPNKLATFGPQDDQRLDDYRRADISVEYNHSVKDVQITISGAIFNLFDRRNPWYRELSLVVDRNSASNRFKTVPVDVYDIGFQPSFNLSIDF